MVMPVWPSKFYGSSLPRPRVYNDIKFNSERVDPPMGVTNPFLSWAKDAPWSMGGFAHKRKRLQGSIEGTLKKLRNEEEKEPTKEIRKKKGEEKCHETQEKRSTPVIKSRAPVSPAESSPANRRTYSAEDKVGSPTVVPETEPRYRKKISTPVGRRVRKLSEVFNRQAAAASAGREAEGLMVHSLAQSVSKRQAAKEMEAYEYVEQPYKVARITTQKKNNAEKEGQGIESEAGGSSSGKLRRSRRFSPVA